MITDFNMKKQTWQTGIGGGYLSSKLGKIKTKKNDNYISIVVRVIDATKAVRILGSNFDKSQINKITIDGVESEIISDTLMFPNTGDFTVNIYMNPTNLYSLFAYCDRIVKCDFTNLDTSKVTTMNRMCFRMYNLEELCIKNLNIANVTDMMGAFAYLYLIKSIDISHLNTSKVTNFFGLFLKDYILEEVKGCKNLVTKACEDASAIFSGTKVKNVDTSNWDTSNVTTFNNAFCDSKIEKLDLSHLDMSKATCYDCMFEACPNLTEVKLGKINPEATITNIFNEVRTNGILYYDSKYDYSKIIAALPTDWTARSFESIKNEKSFLSNISKGGKITLSTPVELTNAAVVKGTSSINLNNQTITGGLFSESEGIINKGNSDSYAFWVKEGGDLTIDGEGEVKTQAATYSMAVWAQGGKVIINGGIFSNAGEGSDLIYASNGGKVYIYGGEFHACEKQAGVSGTTNKYSALNIKDSDRGISEIVVYGGKFYGFDPANNTSEGPNTNFVANGYKSVEIETNVWEIIKE